MLNRWRTLSSKVVQRNPFWSYRVDSFEITNGVSGEYHCVHTEGSSLIIPIRDDGKLALINQYRYLCNRESIEFPCGGVKPGKSHDETAKTELEEETGFQSDNFEKVGEFNPYNGITDEFCSVYIARDLRRTESRPDATEEFEVIALAPEELDRMVQRNEIWDGMTLAAWTIVRNKFIKG